MQEEQKLCLCCGAKLIGRYERVSKGLALSLIKFRKKVLTQEGLNKVHLAKDLSLSKNEYNNFQKLRYHGLIAHYKDKVTREYETGYWLLTKRGNTFCKNELPVPKKLLIFRNRIQERSDDKILLQDVLNNADMPFWDSRDDFGISFDDTNDYDSSDDGEDNQLELF